MPDDTTALIRIVEQIEDHYGCRLGVTGLADLDEAAQYERVMTRMTEQQLVAPGTSRDELRGLLNYIKSPAFPATDAYTPRAARVGRSGVSWARASSGSNGS